MLSLLQMSIDPVHSYSAVHCQELQPELPQRSERARAAGGFVLKAMACAQGLRRMAQVGNGIV